MNLIQRRADRVRGIALESVLHLAGAQPDRHDRHKWHTTEGVLSVTGPKFMNWSQGIGGGGAIDLVLHPHHGGFMEALQWLEHHFPGSLAPEAPQLRNPRSLELPAPSRQKLGRVRDYLVIRRRLPPTLLDPLIDTGFLYADTHANAVFLLLGEKNHPVGAELRGTGHPWRGMAPGSRKELGFFAAGPASASSLVLCESAIDALSCCALHPQHRSLSTAGARPDPRWLRSLIAQGHHIFCGFDADPTGDATAQAMIARYPSVQRMRPSGKDWNDLLRST